MSNVVRFVLMSGGLWVSFTRYGIHAAVAVLAISSFVAYFVLFPAIKRNIPKAFWFEALSAAVFTGCLVLAAIIPFPFR